MRVLVSACLLGRNCKYNGGNNYCQKAVDFLKEHEAIAVCPEVMAGMPTPRTPIEIVNGRLMDAKGTDVDAALRAAVDAAMVTVREQGIDLALLQSRSPTCGVNRVYDGSFSGRLIPGSGVFAQALKAAGIPVLDAEDLP